MTCANNEERTDKRPKEARLFCYICDDCTEYNGIGLRYHYRKRTVCADYKISDHEVERRQMQIRLMEQCPPGRGRKRRSRPGIGTGGL